MNDYLQGIDEQRAEDDKNHTAGKDARIHANKDLSSSRTNFARNRTLSEGRDSVLT